LPNALSKKPQMITLNVVADVGAIQARLNRIKQGVGDQLIVATLNETIQATQTQITRAIAKDYNIKQSDIREQLSIQRASRKGQRFEATLYGKKSGAKWSFNASRFIVTSGQKRRVARALRLSQAFGGNVSFGPQVQIRKGSVRTIPGAFVLNVPGQPIVHRVSGKLRGVQTVGVPQMFDRPSIQKPIIKFVPTKFAEIFARRLRYFASTIK
jgi:hypothetical protein